MKKIMLFFVPIFALNLLYNISMTASKADSTGEDYFRVVLVWIILCSIISGVSFLLYKLYLLVFGSKERQEPEPSHPRDVVVHGIVVEEGAFRDEKK